MWKYFIFMCDSFGFYLCLRFCLRIIVSSCLIYTVDDISRETNKAWCNSVVSFVVGVVVVALSVYEKWFCVSFIPFTPLSLWSIYRVLCTVTCRRCVLFVDSSCVFFSRSFAHFVLYFVFLWVCFGLSICFFLLLLFRCVLLSFFFPLSKFLFSVFLHSLNSFPHLSLSPQPASQPATQ